MVTPLQIDGKSEGEDVDGDPPLQIDDEGKVEDVDS